MNKKDEIPGRPKGTFASRLRQQASLQVILLLGLLFLAVFSYVPMVGIIISFKEYKLSTGLMGFFTSGWPLRISRLAAALRACSPARGWASSGS